MVLTQRSERVPNLTRLPRKAGKASDLTIRRDATFRDTTHHAVYAIVRDAPIRVLAHASFRHPSWGRLFRHP